MTDYTLTLTPEELDELDRIVRMQERQDYTEMMSGGKKPEVAKRNKIQNRIIGKIMDAERREREICPERDPDNPLLPVRRADDGKT